jgi:hypothetical protein
MRGYTPLTYGRRDQIQDPMKVAQQQTMIAIVIGASIDPLPGNWRHGGYRSREARMLA